MKARLNQNNKAFTLVEVLIALAILTFAVSAIVSIQARLFERLIKDRDWLQKTFLCERVLVTMAAELPKDKMVQKHEFEDLGMKTTTHMLSPTKKSVFKSLDNDLYILKLLGRWNLMGHGQQEKEMVMLVAVPPENKEKEKGKK